MPVSRGLPLIVVYALYYAILLYASPSVGHSICTDPRPVFSCVREHTAPRVYIHITICICARSERELYARLQFLQVARFWVQMLSLWKIRESTVVILGEEHYWGSNWRNFLFFYRVEHEESFGCRCSRFGSISFIIRCAMTYNYSVTAIFRILELWEDSYVTKAIDRINEAEKIIYCRCNIISLGSTYGLFVVPLQNHCDFQGWSFIL